jgi:hypothetical protein
MSQIQSNILVENTRERSVSYRDRVYIVKDIILRLIEYGKMNQTAVTTFVDLI